MKTLALLTLALAALAVGSASAATRASAPAIRYVDDEFGPVLTTRAKQALYYWTAENDFKIHCKGECARLWPPLVVRRRRRRPRARRRHQGNVRHDQAARRPAPGHLQPPSRLHVRPRGTDGGALQRRRRLVRRPPALRWPFRPCPGSDPWHGRKGHAALTPGRSRAPSRARTSRCAPRRSASPGGSRRASRPRRSRACRPTP